MSEMVQVTFQVDEEDKAAVEQVCADMGITMEYAFMCYVEKVVQEKRIPFDYSEELLELESEMK